jgi:hypothetical protein
MNAPKRLDGKEEANVASEDEAIKVLLFISTPINYKTALS